MRIGKPGVEINEYEKSDDPNAVIGYIQPGGKNPQWILWFTNRGDAILHRKRAKNGGIEDEPLRITR